MLLSGERAAGHSPSSSPSSSSPSSSGRLSGGCMHSVGEALRRRTRLTSPADALRIQGGSAEAEAEAEAGGRADASAATKVRGRDGDWTANFRLGPEIRPRLTRLPSRLSTGPTSGEPSAIEKRPLAAVLAAAAGSSSSTDAVLELFTVNRRRRSPCTSLPPGELGTDEHESHAVKPESQRERLRLCEEGMPSASTPSSRSVEPGGRLQDSVLLRALRLSP